MGFFAFSEGYGFVPRMFCVASGESRKYIIAWHDVVYSRSVGAEYAGFLPGMFPCIANFTLYPLSMVSYAGLS